MATIGGASAADDVSKAIGLQLLGRFMWGVADTETVRAMLGPLSNTHAKILIEALPATVAFITAKMPMAVVGNSPTAAAVLKEIIGEATNEFVEIVRRGGTPSAADATKALSDAAGGLMASKVLVDPLRHFHHENCANLAAIKPPAPQQQQQRQQGRNAPPPPPPPVPHQPFQELTLQEALRQNLQASPCCFQCFKASVGGNAPPAKPKKFSSVMHLLGSMEPSKRARLLSWYAVLTPADLQHADKGLIEIDNEEELDAFLDAIEQHPNVGMGWLKFLSGRKLTDPFEPYVAAAITAIKRGAAEAHRELRAFDQSLAPEVAKLQAKREARQQARAQRPPVRRAPPKPASFWRTLWNTIKPF